MENPWQIRPPTQHYFLGMNMTALSEGNFLEQMFYNFVNDIYTPVQMLMLRSVGDSSNPMINLNGTYKTTEQGVLAFANTATLVYGSTIRGGSVGINTIKSEGFEGMMESTEAIRYAKYWQNYAPKQVAPGIKRMDWLRRSGRTGRMEKSRVIYDSYGRQIYRIDFSDHMRPLNHSKPHLHQYEYGPMSSFGKESIFNFFEK